MFPTPIRLEVLSPVYNVKFHSYSDSFRFTILSNEQIETALLREQLISNYYQIVRTRGTSARVTHTVQRNLEQQLLFLGANFNCFERFFSSFVKNSNENPNSLKEAINLLDICENFSKLITRPILSVSLFNSQLSSSHLTHDTRFNVYIDELILFDFHFHPILHIFPKNFWNHPMPAMMNSSHSHHARGTSRKRANSTQYKFTHNRRYSSLPIPELQDKIRSLKNSSAISIIILSRNESSSNAHPNLSEINFEIENFDVLLTPSTIPTIFDSLLPLVDDLSRRYCLENSKNAPPFSLATRLPPINSTLNLQADCLHLVWLSDTRDYFAEYVLDQIYVHLPNLNAMPTNEHTNPESTKREFDENSSWSLRLGAIEIHDLSLSGSLHPTVLSKVQSTESDPMVTLTISFPKGCEVTMVLTGVRFCVLTRFFRELIGNLLPRFSFLLKTTFDSYLSLFKSFPRTKQWLIEFFGHLDSKQYPFILSLFSSLRKSYPDFFFLPKHPLMTSSLLQVSAELFNTVLIFPRNSNSNDLVALTIDKISYKRCHVTESWEPLPKSVITDPREFFYFDPVLNSWNSSNFHKTSHSQDESTPPSPSSLASPAGGSQQPDGRPQPEIIEIPHSHSGISISKTAIGNSILSKLFDNLEDSSDDSGNGARNVQEEKLIHSYLNLDTISPDSLVSVFDGGDYDDEPNEDLRISPPSVRTGGAKIKRISIKLEDLDSESDSDDDEFYDTQMPDNILPQTNKSVHPHPTSTRSNNSSEKHSSIHKHLSHFREQFVRHQLSFQSINLYISFYSPSFSSSDYDSTQEADFLYRKFLPISPKNSVYSQLSMCGTSTSLSIQKWQKLSISPFHAFFLGDVVDKKIRVLISDLPNVSLPTSFKPSTVHIQISISEYFLLLSLYYDNFSEESQFSSPDDGDSPRQPYHPNGPGNNQTRDRPFTAYPSYGTREYIDYIRNSSFDFEIHLVRSEIVVNFMMNSINSSASLIPSLIFLTIDPQSYVEDDFTPFASLQIKWLSFHSFHGKIANQIAFGIGDLLLTDTRSIDRSHGVHTIRLSQPSPILHHGHAYFNYGTQQSTSSLLSLETTYLPLQVVYFEILYGWKTAFLGLQQIDVDTQNLELFYLFRDFFTLYHHNPIFGNPAIQGKLMMDPSLWPITGVDLQFFFVNPHFQIAESPYPTSNCVVVEAVEGLAVRVTTDRLGSVDIHLHAQDLALVLLKSYQNSTATIGIRGTAGSGLGIRTILDQTTLSLSYHFDHELQQTDFQLVVAPKSQFSLEEDFFSTNLKLSQDGVFSLFSSSYSDQQDFHPLHPHLSDAESLPHGSQRVISSCSRIVLSYDDFISLTKIFHHCFIDSQGISILHSWRIRMVSLLAYPS